MDSLPDLAIFVAVVEAGGFSRAAARLGMTKSGVSRRVSGLEQRLGVRLLQRTTRRQSLTEAGAAYFDHAVEALRHAQAAEDAATRLQAEPQGQLRVHAPMAFGRLHVAPLVPAFLDAHPGLTLDLVLDDIAGDLVADGFDVALRAGDLPDSTLIVRRLASLRSVVCAAPAYLDRQLPPQVPSDLQQHNCIQFSYSDNGDVWRFARDGAEEAVRVSGRYRVNNSEALCQALLHGFGLGRVPTFIAGPLIASGQLVQVLSRYVMPAKTLYAVFPERAYRPAKVEAFMAFLLSRLGGDPPGWDQGFAT